VELSSNVKPFNVSIVSYASHHVPIALLPLDYFGELGARTSTSNPHIVPVPSLFATTLPRINTITQPSYPQI